MIEQAILLKLSAQELSESTTSQLRQEYLAYQKLFGAQPALGQQELDHQAANLAVAILKGASPVHFSLPEHVVCLPAMDCIGVDGKIPSRFREQRVGSLVDRLTHPNLTLALSQRLSELERSSDQAVAAAAGLIRYSVARQMIDHLVPEGRAVVYAASDDDEIPNQPVREKADPPDAGARLEASIDAVDSIESHDSISSTGSFARGFYLPSLVAFDEQNRLLVANLDEATAELNALRRFLLALNSAMELAPYVVVDEAYQYKRYGILGQLVNQGRSFASYEVDKICQVIKERSDSHRLDRGFSLSLPYFNDKTLAVEQYNFDVIPKGRVMFVPAFVVLAVRAEAAKVAQYTHLNRTTRRSLLLGLCALEKAFLR